MIHLFNRARAALRDIGKPKRSPKWRALEKHWIKEHSVCEVCGGKNHLQVHHRIPFHVDPSKELDPANLVTLCMGRKSCHLKIGHGGSFSAFNPELADMLSRLKQGILTFVEAVKTARAKRKK